MAKRLTSPFGRDSRPVTRSAAPQTVDGLTDNDPGPDGAETLTVQTVKPTDVASLREAEALECAICLQPCVHPVRLPCTHIFCFLCVKGVAIQSKRCALCRQDIPADFFNNPALLRKEDLLKDATFEGGYQWYYQGINGWWQYDERASSEIEDYYKTLKDGKDKHLEILIAGFLYVIDFENMLQYRRNDPSRRRKIKRDLITIPDRKGVAGLKINPQNANTSPHRLQGDGGENVPRVVQGTGAQSTQATAQPAVAARRVHKQSPRQRTGSPAGGDTPLSSSTSPTSVPHNTPENPAAGRSSPPDSLTSQLAGLQLDPPSSRTRSSRSATSQPRVLPQRPNTRSSRHRTKPGLPRRPPTMSGAEEPVPTQRVDIGAGAEVTDDIHMSSGSPRPADTYGSEAPALSGPLPDRPLNLTGRDAEEEDDTSPEEWD